LPTDRDIPTLRQLANLEEEALPVIEHRLSDGATPEESLRFGELRRLVREASQNARARIVAIERLTLQANEFARLEYDFLFDKARHLLTQSGTT
jgi:hypothetical protein